MSPRDMVWTRGKRKEILSYYISEFLVGEGGLQAEISQAPYHFPWRRMLYQCESCIDASQIRLLPFNRLADISEISLKLEHAECRDSEERHK